MCDEYGRSTTYATPSYTTPEKPIGRHTTPLQCRRYTLPVFLFLHYSSRTAQLLFTLVFPQLSSIVSIQSNDHFRVKWIRNNVGNASTILLEVVQLYTVGQIKVGFHFSIVYQFKTKFITKIMFLL